MKTIKLLLAAVTAASIFLSAAPIIRADEIKVEVGDRPYYRHGPRYWDHDYEMVWAPGHWDESHHWVHGMYNRGEHRHHHHDHDHDNH
ncbi:MAG TPA: hypothetical protein VLK27_11120 [Chthoniobacterales bacterium]|nr:hypothetical protein [Chthoniobacterales bacterium]